MTIYADMSLKDARSLQRAYNKAVKAENSQFIWQGQTVLTAYAKYLLQYLQSCGFLE